MPFTRIALSPGAFDADRLQGFVTAVTDAAMRAESVPEGDAALRRRSIVMLDEKAPGTLLWGAELLDEQIRGVFADFYGSAGVLDAARKARFTAEFHAAAQSATAADDQRLIVSSVIFHEVPEGNWGRSGVIARVPDMAHSAGFTHLASVAVAPQSR